MSQSVKASYKHEDRSSIPWKAHGKVRCVTYTWTPLCTCIVPRSPLNIKKKKQKLVNHSCIDLIFALSLPLPLSPSPPPHTHMHTRMRAHACARTSRLLIPISYCQVYCPQVLTSHKNITSETAEDYLYLCTPLIPALGTWLGRGKQNSMSSKSAWST